MPGFHHSVHALNEWKEANDVVLAVSNKQPAVPGVEPGEYRVRQSYIHREVELVRYAARFEGYRRQESVNMTRWKT